MGNEKQAKHAQQRRDNKDRHGGAKDNSARPAKRQDSQKTHDTNKKAGTAWRK
ncbi:MAG: hypothetical protein NTW79_02280 [Candidatus Berkelbacteria bacterium]|nr:hypothetical protein [Candidatus Berkelbacteria bacterium]